MNVQQGYNQWASQYDTNENKTRDLEALAIRELLDNVPFSSCLEIGCGTGKNSVWLSTKAGHLTAVDLSEEMMQKAKAKVSADKVQFIRGDILQNWDFIKRKYDLVTFSLVLEHIEDMEPVIRKSAAVLNPGGYIYIGELHPFKQYAGSKARFETEEGLQVVPCFNHHVSDFINAAMKNGLKLVILEDIFDGGNRETLPRLIVMLFQKQ